MENIQIGNKNEKKDPISIVFGKIKVNYNNIINACML